MHHGFQSDLRQPSRQMRETHHEMTADRVRCSNSSLAYSNHVYLTSPPSHISHVFTPTPLSITSNDVQSNTTFLTNIFIDLGLHVSIHYGIIIRPSLKYTDPLHKTINRFTPNDPYMGRTAPLTAKRCILYIYSTNIGTEYFKHALYSPFFLFKMQFVS